MKKKLTLIIISAFLFIIGIIGKFPNEWINRGIFIVSYLVIGFEVLKEAVEHIAKGKIFDENFLMTIATLGAFAIGEFPEAVAVMLFYQIGESLQDYAVDKSRDSITKLMDIRPDFANVLRESIEKKVNPNEVRIGEIILVKPGEKIPLDGKIIEGTSTLDTRALTGETVPKSVRQGDEVLSGCINQDGLLKIKVTKEFEKSTASKILELVENASSKKAKAENFITKFAEIYTPVVVIIAVILAIIPPLLFKNETFSEWIYRALSFLVVSCPCALVISIPLSFFGGIGGASRRGVLVKGSNYLEQLAKTQIVVFDKTGTLTKGVFEVQNINPEKMSKEKLLELAVYAEMYSTHPIAKSLKEAYGKALEENKIKDIQEISGHGISAKVDDKEVLVGNAKLMDINKIEYKKCDNIGTVIYIAINKEFAGSIVISDKIKEDSKIAINELKKNGIKQTIMLTGDRKEVAEDVAKKLNIDIVHFELLPDGKVKKVEELIKNKNGQERLAYVGDGINDAPVLAISDVGIAMGGLGSDSAIEAADIVIMTDETSRINDAIKISKKTMKIVKENIIFAISVKILVLILSAFGIATMWSAVFADVGVSIIAILNALRIVAFL